METEENPSIPTEKKTMIEHSNNADYHRIGGGVALSYDEQHPSHPLLIVDDRTEKTLVALDAQAVMNLYEFLREHRAQLNKPLETSNEHAEPTTHTHQVVVDGKVIYTGEDWPLAFLEASKNPDYGEIVYLHDGQPGARFSAPLAPDALRAVEKQPH